MGTLGHETSAASITCAALQEYHEATLARVDEIMSERLPPCVEGADARRQKSRKG
jgi:hypothetical protein